MPTFLTSASLKRRQLCIQNQKVHFNSVKHTGYITYRFYMSDNKNQVHADDVISTCFDVIDVQATSDERYYEKEMTYRNQTDLHHNICASHLALKDHVNSLTLKK